MNLLTRVQKKYIATGFVIMLSIVHFSPGWAVDVSDITGQWITFDDHSGEKRSIVTISENGGKLSGHISKVFFKPGDETKCVNCKGEKHNQNIIGLEIFDGLTLNGKVWQGASILDPENGKEYKCKMWLEGDTLYVRGYLFLFYRTQKWMRYQQVSN